MHELIYINIEAVMKIFIVTSFTFLLAMLVTPILTHFLYKYKIGQQIRKETFDHKPAPVYENLHKDKAGTPTMGGVLVWLTVLAVTFLFYLSARFTNIEFLKNLNFLKRSQTWLPLFTLAAAGILGAFDDLVNAFSKKLQAGLGVSWKFIWQILIAGVGAWWFYSKLDVNFIHVPGIGNFTIGLFYIPLFILVIIAACNAVNITDGLDGLAGGVLATSYGAFGALALAKGQIELAAFCGAILGALLAFLWFNIYPARFFMGDTGALALGATLGVVALLLNSVLVLPIIGFIFVIETGSVIIQWISKKTRGGKKIFLSTPIHHHFEALGWPEPKIVMRFWVISGVFAIIGLIIGLIGRG